jgi:hypothetical protein
MMQRIIFMATATRGLNWDHRFQVDTTEAPTDAPTEAPTDAPTDETTESPTGETTTVEGETTTIAGDTTTIEEETTTIEGGTTTEGSETTTVAPDTTTVASANVEVVIIDSDGTSDVSITTNGTVVTVPFDFSGFASAHMLNNETDAECSGECCQCIANVTSELLVSSSSNVLHACAGASNEGALAVCDFLLTQPGVSVGMILGHGEVVKRFLCRCRELPQTYPCKRENGLHGKEQLHSTSR